MKNVKLATRTEVENIKDKQASLFQKLNRAF
jgi:hypothetical protein